MTTTDSFLTEAPPVHWISRAAFPIISTSLFATQGALGYAVYREWWWLAVPLVIVCCHLMHGMLIGFHEASHRMLRKSRLLNEIDGQLIAVFSLMSFTLYRAAHQTHHSHLGTERDEELWPFVLTKTPRWARVLAAFLELFAGMLFTPLLFLRTFLRTGSPIRSARVRKRIWMELTLMVAVWVCILTTVAALDLWKYFLWMHLIPGAIAANLQSWRKYIEHVGLTGSTVRSATRSIVADGWVGKAVSLTLLHEPYHGVHHLRGGLFHAEMPHYASELHPELPEERAPFPSYTRALADLVRGLSDPRVGAQWQHVSDQRPESNVHARV